MPNPDASPTASATARWREAFALADAWETLTPSELAAQFEALKATDAAFAAMVQPLLKLNADSEAPTAAPFTQLLATAISPSASPLRAGDLIDKYTLIKEIGKGGMADVWLAERTDGALKRAVALKLPIALLPNHLLAERFARERDILAQLDHANIARIYDTGTTPNGQPYLALEYINGTALTLYCAEHRLSLDARVRLIAQAADAVHHAHTHLVLHRDIKPSNMLVTQEGDLKLLDFGIAKLLSTETMSAEETQFTKLTGSAMTPKYAAPEQLVSHTVTTATDVFALGVVLYELLTGRLPYTDGGKDLMSRLKSIDTPCIALDQAALPAESSIRFAHSNVKSWRRALQGDLAAIAAKALRLDAKDRYPTASALAEDCRRYLDGYSVLARDGALIYRAKKYLWRNRMPVSIAAAGVCAALGLGHQTWQQHQRANDNLLRAESVDGLMASLFEGMSPDVAKSRTFTAKELLDRARGFLSSNAANENASTSAASLRMGNLYRDIGDFNDALQLFGTARASAQLNRDTPREIDALWNLTDVSTKANQLAAARTWLDAANQLAAKTLKIPDARLAQLALAEGQLADFEDRPSDAKTHYQNAESQLRTFVPPNLEQLVWAIQGQAHAARDVGDLATARSKMREVLQLDQERPVRGEIDRLHSQAFAAKISLLDGRFKEALAPLKSVCHELITRLGNGPLHTRETCRDFAAAAIRQGQWDDARQTLHTLRASYSAQDHIELGRIDQLGALMTMYQGRAAEAEPFLRRAVEIESHGESTATDLTLRMRRYVGENLLRQGRTEAGLIELIDVAKQLQARRGESHPDYATTATLIAIGYLRQGKIAQAHQMLEDAASVLTRMRGIHHPFTLSALAYLEIARASPAQPALAARLREELGWQSGANTLANWIESKGKPAPFSTLPVVL
jgi:eukaryotic-like serine/threonine-protein kinase